MTVEYLDIPLLTGTVRRRPRELVGLAWPGARVRTRTATLELCAVLEIGGTYVLRFKVIRESE